MVTLSPPVATYVLARFLGMETTNTLSRVIVYSALFNNVFKALNLFLNKYVAETQLPGNDLWLLSVPQRFYTEF
jgi:hypothetical protein